MRYTDHISKKTNTQLECVMQSKPYLKEVYSKLMQLQSDAQKQKKIKKNSSEDVDLVYSLNCYLIEFLFLLFLIYEGNFMKIKYPPLQYY